MVDEVLDLGLSDPADLTTIPLMTEEQATELGLVDEGSGLNALLFDDDLGVVGLHSQCEDEDTLDLSVLGEPFRGLSAYEDAVRLGFQGTLAEWLLSLVGPESPNAAEARAAQAAAEAAALAAQAARDAALIGANDSQDGASAAAIARGEAEAYRDEAGLHATASLELRTQVETDALLAGTYRTQTSELLEAAELSTARAVLAEGAVIDMRDETRGFVEAASTSSQEASGYLDDARAEALAARDAQVDASASRDAAHGSAVASFNEAERAFALATDAAQYAEASQTSRLAADAALLQTGQHAQAVIDNTAIVIARADEAGEYAEAADAHRLAANTSAGAAQVSAENSAISETNADGSRVAAEAARQVAVDMATEAGDHAAAALQSEEQAAIYADESGTIYGVVASRVDTVEAQLAGTQGSQLQVRIGNEETARIDGDTALGQRTSVVESQAGGLLGATNGVFNFEQNGLFWRSASQYAPNHPSFNPPSSGTYPVVAGIGKVAQIDASASYQERSPNTALPLAPGRRLRCSARVRLIAGTLGSVGYLYNLPLTADYMQATGYSAHPIAFTAYNVWRLFELEFDSDVLIAGGGAYWRPMVAFTPSPGAIYQVQYIEWEDITKVDAATARIGVEETTRASQTSALALRSDTLEAQMANTQSSGLTARIDVVEQARIDGDAAIAGRTTVMEARSRGGSSLLVNSRFGSYPTAWGIPPSWQEWIGGTAGVRAIDAAGDFSFVLTGGAGANAGISQNSQAVAKQGDYVVIEATVYLASGALTGAGILLYVFNAAIATYEPFELVFSTTPDSTGVVPGAGIVGKTYSFSKLFKVTKADAAIYRVYAITHYSGFGSIAAANQLYWKQASIRPATSSEIELNQARGSTASLSARFTEEINARASADNAAATRVSTLEATRAGPTILHYNAGFDLYTNPVGTPDIWGPWAAEGTYSRTAGPNGGYSVVIPAAAGAPAGISQYSNIGTARPGNYYVIEADITLNSGALTGAGVYCVDAKADGTSLDNRRLSFALDPVNGGSAVGAGVAGTRYQFSKLFQSSADSGMSRHLIYAMSHWDGLEGSTASIAAANSITWHTCGVRPATASEIELQQARGASTSLAARITTEETARASADAANAARTTTLEATNRQGFSNQNPFFDDWAVGGSPKEWVLTTPANASKVGGIQRHPNAIRIASPGVGAQDFIQTASYYRGPPGYYVVSCSFTLNAGSLMGMALSFRGYDEGISTLLSASDNRLWELKDSTNTVPGLGVVGRTYEFSVLVNLSHPSTRWSFLYLFVDGYHNLVAKNVDVHHLGFRPATELEVAAGVALPALSARVTTTESVALDAQGRALALRETVLDVNGYVSGTRSANNGTTSSFAIRSDVFSIQSPGGGARTEYSGGNWRVYDANGVLRTRMGIW